MNKKGFTLIEILAVIIILSILLLLAVPSVSKYITNSKIDTYEKNLTKLVDSVITNVNTNSDGKYNFALDEVLVVPLSSIEVESGSSIKSPFGQYIDKQSFIVVTRKQGISGYNYYVTAIDSKGYGTINISYDNIKISNNPQPITIDLVKESYIKNNKETYKLSGIVSGSDLEIEILGKRIKLVDSPKYGGEKLTLDEIKAGDYVQYSPNNGTYSVVGGDNGTGIDKIQTFTTDPNLNYRIYNIGDNYIEIIPTTYANNLLALKGAPGFNHGINILNDLCNKLYSNSSIGAVARSLNVDDIYAKTTVEAEGLYYHAINNPWPKIGSYNNTNYTNGKSYPVVWDKEKTITSGRSSTNASTSYLNKGVYEYTMAKDHEGKEISVVEKPLNTELYYSHVSEKIYVSSKINKNLGKNTMPINLFDMNPSVVSIDSKDNVIASFDPLIHKNDIRKKNVTCNEVSYSNLTSYDFTNDRCIKIVNIPDEVYSDADYLKIIKSEIRKNNLFKGLSWVATRNYVVDPTSLTYPDPNNPNKLKNYKCTSNEECTSLNKEFPNCIINTGTTYGACTQFIEYPHISVITWETKIQAQAMYDASTSQAFKGASYSNYVMPIIKIPISDSIKLAKVYDVTQSSVNYNVIKLVSY